MNYEQFMELWTWALRESGLLITGVAPIEESLDLRSTDRNCKSFVYLPGLSVPASWTQARSCSALAEREGIEAKSDRVQTWMLDLQQASSCEERKVAIELLAQSSDRRAIVALKRARAMKCVEQDAANAIARIDAAAK
jgi:hypothetical protein